MKRPKDRLQKVLIIGATPSGIVAANKLGELGIPVTLVDSEANIDRKLSNPDWQLASGLPLNHAHRPGLIRLLRNPGIKLVLQAEVNSIKHNHQGFRVNITRYPTFVDPARCTLCGRCVETCPVSLSDDKKAVDMDNRLSLPGGAVIDKRRLPLCRENCPLGVNVQGYIALTKEGRYSEALALIREKNVLPGICGRICTHPCETNCRRAETDDSVSIRSIKRFLADRNRENGNSPAAPIETRSEKIAVIGSGPAGLAAAAELARYGCQVTIFEKESMAGGLLRYGIGPHRLPRDILDEELYYIQSLGVRILTSHPIDLDNGLSELSQSFDAVLICSGTWKDRRLGVPGEDLSGVEGCLSFLNDFYRGNIKAQKQNPAQKVAVIGDGNAAYDLARTLIRTGSQVTMVSWFAEDKIPADPEEIKAASEEGIQLVDNTQVVEFSGKNGKFERLICRPTQAGPPDKNGIAWPVIVENSSPFELVFDRAFVAIGQTGALKENTGPKGLKVSPAGFVERDKGHKTNIPNVYVAGDASQGPSSVVQAMADGLTLAGRVLWDICLVDGAPGACERPAEKDFPEIQTDMPALKRATMPERQPSRRLNNFSEVALGLPESQVLYEAQRCLQCGVCSECLQCIDVCEATRAIRHHDPVTQFNEQAGVVIIANPEMGSKVKGDDVVRAYGTKSSDSDVNTMLLRGFSAAERALILLGNTAHNLKGRALSFSQPEPELSGDIRIGVFICRCNDSVGWMDGLDHYLEALGAGPDMVHVQTIPAACVPDGSGTIMNTVREKGITRIVLASCVCCSLNFVCSACTDQRSRLKRALFTATGISRSMVATCNIRGEALSLIHSNPDLAQKRFEGIVDRSIRQARRLLQYPSLVRSYNFTTAVIGESEAALASAQALAETGMDVYIFEVSQKYFNPVEYPNVYCYENCTIKSISGTLGDFQLTIETGDFEQTVQVGAVILGERSRKKIKYVHQEGLPSQTIAYAMQQEGITGIPFLYPGMTSISGLFLANPPDSRISNRIKGSAAAVLATSVMPRGPRQSKGYTIVVDEALCRGCGRCIQVCPYQAIILRKNAAGGWSASVDEPFCKGCGNCISVCPSNAADSPYRSQMFLERSLEEILLQ